MADQQDVAAIANMAKCLLVNLGDERTGCVEIEKVAGLGVGRNGFRHAVGGEYHRLAGGRYLVEFPHEDRTLCLKPLDHVAIVDDLMANIYRSAVLLESEHDHLDGTVHTGTKPSRAAETQDKFRAFAIVHLMS